MVGKGKCTDNTTATYDALKQAECLSLKLTVQKVSPAGSSSLTGSLVTSHTWGSQ